MSGRSSHSAPAGPCAVRPCPAPARPPKLAAVSEVPPTPSAGRSENALGPLAAAFRGARRVTLRRDAIVLSEGDASERVVLLMSGRVKVSTVSEEGQETVLGYRGAGEVLGELSAIDGEPHNATVTVVESGEALVVPAERFVDALAGDPGAALALLRAVVARLRDADRTRADFTARDVVGRVAHRVVELADAYGRPSDGGIEIDLPISQRELAGWVGSSREAANKALAELEHRGLVRVTRRRLTVRDVEGLRGLAR
jgi:CRP/FNR family transcriptional regulator, cyclic AMP receptor protein